MRRGQPREGRALHERQYLKPEYPAGRGRGCDIVALILGLLVFIYVAIRAAMLSFTHDESLTYIYHVMPGIIGCLDFSVATNHFLNSFLMLALSSLFGSGEFVLRLPNVVAYAAYAVGTWLIVRGAGSRVLALSGFVLLNFNPYVLDFFSLARGYGMSLAFMVLSMWFVTRRADDRDARKKLVAGALWFAFLAVISNLVFLNYYVALVAAVLLQDVWQEARVPTESAKPGSCSSGLSSVFKRVILKHLFVLPHLLLGCIFALPVGLGLRQSGELYYGGKAGFWSDVVGSLGAATAYDSRNPAIGVFAVNAFLGIMGFLCLARLVSVGRKMDSRNNGFAALLVIFGFTVLSVVLQHWLMGTNYPSGRTALFFIPLFILPVVLLWEITPQTGTVHSMIAAKALLATFALLLVVHLGLMANVKHTFDWKYDANTKQAMLDVAADHEKKQTPGMVSIGISWVFEPTVNYYRLIRDMTWLKQATRNGVGGKYDYYYCLPCDSVAMGQTNAVLIATYHPSGAGLYKLNEE